MSPLANNAQAMRAIFSLRSRSFVSQGYFSGLWRAYRNTAQAPTTRIRRK